jgi:lysophospholipid acyltransferase (LPLAT)-like uncharacterized protein
MALKKLQQQILLALIPPVYRLLTGLLFASCRIKIHDFKFYQECVKTGKPFIVVFWHYGLLLDMTRNTGIEFAAMVSASRDGEYISRTLNSMGIVTVRGSRNKGGLGAMKKLLRYLKQGKTAALVADGSQGPARIMQPGAILLASRTGLPVIAIGWGANRYKAFRSWDRISLPLPFARVALWYSEPLQVPPKLDTAGIEKYRQIMEERLNDLYHKSWGEFGIKEH